MEGCQDVAWPDPYQRNPVTGKPYVTGIIWLHSRFKVKDITDGLSSTYLIGEKYVDLDAAKDGASMGDDQGPLVSDDRDVVRWAGWMPMTDPPNPYTYFRPHHDTRGNPSNPSDTSYGYWGNGTYNFGSAHASGFNMALCDGSVHHVSYDISEEVHRSFCNRADKKNFPLPE
ncbi:MAG: DUF1559 domain-containing protein [Pirellulales bacterium]|nr:DUF1559 domain-containing protein [Pirellulales bacterium]